MNWGWIGLICGFQAPLRFNVACRLSHMHLKQGGYHMGLAWGAVSKTLGYTELPTPLLLTPVHHPLATCLSLGGACEVVQGRAAK